MCFLVVMGEPVLDEPAKPEQTQEAVEEGKEECKEKAESATNKKKCEFYWFCLFVVVFMNFSS